VVAIDGCRRERTVAAGLEDPFAGRLVFAEVGAAALLGELGEGVGHVVG
jgi:hypothetical protein